jgi:AcrR family transcriptional regulator
MNKPRGRRPGAPDTRERILEAARTVFLEKGYPGATMRAVAASADVDVALVSYYFGSKQGLFAAAMTLAVGPATVLEQALTGPPEHLQERIIGAVITTWDDPRLGAPMRMLVAAALQDPALLRVVREYLEREVIARLAERLGGVDATARVTAFVATVAGVIFTRHLLGLEPLADMPPDELTRRLTATRPRPARPT